MESSIAPPGALVQPWRTATLVAVGVALVEFVLVVALAVTLLGSGDSTAAASPAKQRVKKPTAPAKILPRAKTKVLILNGNGRAGAAAAEAQIVESLRYKVAAVGNATRSDYGRSTVLYPAGREREARRLANDLGIQLVGPLDGMKRSKLRGATVAVILGQ